jgi:membrane-associated protease RseP (regulator of RpoE activity)
MALGVRDASFVPIGDGTDKDLFGAPLIFQIIAVYLSPEVPAGSVLVLGPLGLAAWFGFLVTALNLMPVGQLDGGHVAYAILRRRSLPLSRFVQAMGLVLLWYSPLWLAGWW